ncbi:MAG: lactate/malate family dehydrogenase [Pseudonocardiaceae bacterium]
MSAEFTPAAHSVGVVGSGAVGQAVATALVAARFCEQLIIVSRTMEQATSMAADLDDMCLALGSPTRPQAATTAGLQDCQVVVVAVRARFANANDTDIRMGGVTVNGQIIIELALALRGLAGVVVMVTNPVDLMSRLFVEVSGIRRVVGIGSNLDSARYRLILARMFDVPACVVRGSVIGEHGDTLVICASSTTVNGEAVHVPVDRVRAALLIRSRQISCGIGRTRSGPAGAVLSTLRLLLGLVDGVEELCSPYRYGWLGLPVSFTSGHASVRLPQLDHEETRYLKVSEAKLHAAYFSLTEQLQLSNQI